MFLLVAVFWKKSFINMHDDKIQWMITKHKVTVGGVGRDGRIWIYN